MFERCMQRDGVEFAMSDSPDNTPPMHACGRSLLRHLKNGCGRDDSTDGDEVSITVYPRGFLRAISAFNIPANATQNA